LAVVGSARYDAVCLDGLEVKPLAAVYAWCGDGVAEHCQHPGLAPTPVCGLATFITSIPHLSPPFVVRFLLCSQMLAGARDRRNITPPRYQLSRFGWKTID
jgi:hypothetical protein